MRSYSPTVKAVVLGYYSTLLCTRPGSGEAFAFRSDRSRRSIRSQHCSWTHPPEVFRSPSLYLKDQRDDEEDDNQRKPSNATPEPVNDVLSRFTAPRIDDPFLPLSDVLVAQIIAPSLQIAWLSLNHAPSPSWLQPIFATSTLYSSRGSLIAPTLIHGAALASCWIVGALAARAYQQDAIAADADGKLGTVLARVVQAGAFATGILILATQTDLFLEYGRWVQVGETEEIDFRLLVALVELSNDVFFEATTMVTWRLYLAWQSVLRQR